MYGRNDKCPGLNHPLLFYPLSVAGHAHDGNTEPSSTINAPVTFSTGQFAGMTIRMELCEIQAAERGRKYGQLWLNLLVLVSSEPDFATDLRTLIGDHWIPHQSFNSRYSRLEMLALAKSVKSR